MISSTGRRFPHGSGAALGLFYNPDYALFAELQSGRLRVYGLGHTLGSSDWKANTAYLKIVNRHNRVDFLASENGRDWQTLAADVDVSSLNHNVLGGYQCVRPALAASGSGEARFTDFQYQGL